MSLKTLIQDERTKKAMMIYSVFGIFIGGLAGFSLYPAAAAASILIGGLVGSVACPAFIGLMVLAGWGFVQAKRAYVRYKNQTNQSRHDAELAAPEKVNANEQNVKLVAALTDPRTAQPESAQPKELSPQAKSSAPQMRPVSPSPEPGLLSRFISFFRCCSSSQTQEESQQTKKPVFCSL